MISNLNNYDLNKIFVPWNHVGEIAKDHPPTIFDNEILLFRILASQTRLIREAWLHSWWLFYRNGMDTFNFAAINAQLTFREKSFWEITADFTWLQINRPLSLAEETEVVIFSQSKLKIRREATVLAARGLWRRMCKIWDTKALSWKLEFNLFSFCRSSLC